LTLIQCKSLNKNLNCLNGDDYTRNDINDLINEHKNSPLIFVENLDAEYCLVKYESFFTYFNTVIYSDPPYPLKSRKKQRKVYKNEMTDLQHIELIKMLKSYQNVKFLISTYPNSIYQEMLKNYRMIEYYSQTRKGLALENLYMNYEAPSQLHDYSFLGNDFREREKFKAYADNFLRKFREFPLLLQQKILSEL